MTRAAGILFLTPNNEALFLQRGPGSDYPGHWCFPGGTTEADETPEQTAERETIEEIGFLPKGDKAVLTRSISGNELVGAAVEPVTQVPPPAGEAAVPAEPVDYTTFLQKVSERFDPEVSGEHTGFAWALPTEPPEPLHPGCRVALDRLTMDELGIARAMAAGTLTSPQRYHNVHLFDIRITGTGAAYRSGRDEHVWRDASLYLTDEFLQRCNGLTVIWEHPEKTAMLNGEEFANRSIGSVMLPYIKGDEVWSIAKIYDEKAAEAMATEGLSTSPGVVLRGVDDTKVQLEDGSVLLIEGKPMILDHIAVCALGVWDKSGPPAGIRTDSTKESTMSDETEAAEKKAREDKEKADARRDEAIDKVLSGLDAVMKRQDAWEKEAKDRKDAEEKSRRDAEESAMMDAKKRRDEEHEEWKKEDAEACERDDAEEKAECDAHEAKGDSKEVAADKARKDRRKRMDARRKDAEKEEKDRKDAQARADAAKVTADSDLAKRIADGIRAHTRSDSDTAVMADMQMRADAVHQAFGNRAPAPMLGETTVDYRLRLARGLQKHSTPWKEVNLGILENAALNVAESQIYADAVVASRNHDDLPDGQLIPIRRTDPETGHRITEFRGRTTIFKSLSAPSQRVTAFLTANRGA